MQYGDTSCWEFGLAASDMFAVQNKWAWGKYRFWSKGVCGRVCGDEVEGKL